MNSRNNSGKEDGRLGSAAKCLTASQLLVAPKAGDIGWLMLSDDPAAWTTQNQGRLWTGWPLESDLPAESRPCTTVCVSICRNANSDPGHLVGNGRGVGGAARQSRSDDCCSRGSGGVAIGAGGGGCDCRHLRRFFFYVMVVSLVWGVLRTLLLDLTSVLVISLKKSGAAID